MDSDSGGNQKFDVVFSNAVYAFRRELFEVVEHGTVWYTACVIWNDV